MTSETRNCQNCKSEFTIEPDDFVFYEKVNVPPPTRCPECRYLRRLLDRNEYNFYKRKCDATGENIISIYRPDAPFPVYKQDYWRTDAWDALSYGRDFDFNRPFFDQYQELRHVVPHLALVNHSSTNSEYTNQAQNNKDCYMLVTSDKCEKCMYGSWCETSYMLSDCYMVEHCEFCYECINLAKCSNCAWLQNAVDCVNVYFSSYCRGCTDCFGCVGLRNKQYCWFNEQLDKTEYEKRFKEFGWTREAVREAQAKLKKLQMTMPIKYYHGSQNDDSSGDYLENTQRARMAFNCRDNKDTAYMQDAWQQVEDCRDCTEIIIGQRAYEVQGVDSPHRSMFVRSCFNTITDSCYCDMCFGVADCFGCFGLKNKKYCILNKQYNKEDYFALREKIIAHMQQTGEWGEYFPPENSPFAYNESMAQDYFPLTKEQALIQGYHWHERPAPDYKITVNSNQLPHTIAETSDRILEETIQCRTQIESADDTYSACATALRITPLELTLYRKIGVPVPEYCYPCRRTKRFMFRNSRRLYPRKCQCNMSDIAYKNTAVHFHSNAPCPNTFETSYAPDRPEIIYCEQCYNAEVV